MDPWETSLCLLPGVEPGAGVRKKDRCPPNTAWLVLPREGRGLHSGFRGMQTHAQSCLILCNPIDCSPPGSSLHGDSPATILEWVAIFSSTKFHQSPQKSRNQWSQKIMLFSCPYIDSHEWQRNLARFCTASWRFLRPRLGWQKQLTPTSPGGPGRSWERAGCEESQVQERGWLSSPLLLQ